MSTTAIGHFIAGHVEPGTGERTGPVYNPSTGEEIARCDYANRALLDRAVAVATEAGISPSRATAISGWISQWSASPCHHSLRSNGARACGAVSSAVNAASPCTSLRSS